jgi:hypothetical protein
MLMGAGMYFFNYTEVAATFNKLGYPVYIDYPLAVLKILGVIVIWTRKSIVLKDLAYAGFFYDFVLALSAHLVIQDGEFIGAAVALILVVTSYIAQLKYYK